MAREDIQNWGWFVGRQPALQEIADWANDPNPTYRVFSVVAAPGLGKSWLLQKAGEDLQRNGQLVLRVDLSQLVNPAQTRLSLGNDAARRSWLAGEIPRVQSQPGCSHVQAYNSSLTFEAAIDAFVDDLCQSRAGVRPVLVIDGLDEVASTIERQEIEHHLLYRFLGQSCTRILLARRDDYGLSHYALRAEEYVYPLLPLASNEGEDQLQRRALDGPTIQAILAIVAPYTLNHPSINSSLLRRAGQNRPDPVLTCQELRDCLLEAVFPMGSLSNPAFQLLVELAHLQKNGQPLEEWTELQVRSLVPHISNVKLLLTELWEKGMVQQSPRQPQKLFLADGFREVARACRRMGCC
jgi:hypothetical protein